jgi:N-methylhydantoinase B
LAPEITVSALLDRTRTNAWGLFGGGNGASAKLLVKKNGEKDFTTFDKAFGTASATKFTRVVLHRGDEVIIQSPGGGGYGTPADRPSAEVEHDVKQGFLSSSAAQEHYGFKS